MWENDMPNGKDEEIDEYCSIIKTNWIDGVKHGIGTYKDADDKYSKPFLFNKGLMIVQKKSCYRAC
jgi:hypothetical protein